jgi:mono/diheme cytochrome c family protein
MNLDMLTPALACLIALAPAGQIEIVTRAPGVHARFDKKLKKLPKAMKRELVNLKKRSGEIQRLQDPQYNKKRTYRGVSLKRLVLGYKHGKDADLVLFKFANGMVIPWPHTKEALDKLDAFVAVAYKRDDGKWETELPNARRDDRFFNDPVPIKFRGHKLVSPSGFVPALNGAKLNPWRHVDTLERIELADRKAWEEQLRIEATQQPTSAAARRGKDIYLQRCVYCHGVRDVGGDLGPDFARPLAITEYRRPEDIRLKLKVHRMDAYGAGLKMPPQKDIRDDEISALIEFFNAVGKEKAKAPPYAPKGD